MDSSTNQEAHSRFVLNSGGRRKLGVGWRDVSRSLWRSGVVSAKGGNQPPLLAQEPLPHLPVFTAAALKAASSFVQLSPLPKKPCLPRSPRPDSPFLKTHQTSPLLHKAPCHQRSSFPCPCGCMVHAWEKHRAATGFLEERFRNVRKRLRCGKQKSSAEMPKKQPHTIVPESLITSERAIHMSEWLKSNIWPQSKVVEYSLESRRNFIDVKPPGTNIVEYLSNVSFNSPFVLMLGDENVCSQTFVILEGMALEQPSLLAAVDVCFKAYYIMCSTSVTQRHAPRFGNSFSLWCLKCREMSPMLSSSLDAMNE
ncbi:uncharacterized protein V6R79_012081 [Siganus canaliculatus]